MHLIFRRLHSQQELVPLRILLGGTNIALSRIADMDSSFRPSAMIERHECFEGPFGGLCLAHAKQRNAMGRAVVFVYDSRECLFRRLGEMGSPNLSALVRCHVEAVHPSRRKQLVPPLPELLALLISSHGFLGMEVSRALHVTS